MWDFGVLKIDVDGGADAVFGALLMLWVLRSITGLNSTSYFTRWPIYSQRDVVPQNPDIHITFFPTAGGGLFTPGSMYLAFIYMNKAARRFARR